MGREEESRGCMYRNKKLSRARKNVGVIKQSQAQKFQTFVALLAGIGFIVIGAEPK